MKSINKKSFAIAWISRGFMVLGCLLIMAAGVRIYLQHMDQQRAEETSHRLMAEWKKLSDVTVPPTVIPSPVPTIAPDHTASSNQDKLPNTIELPSSNDHLGPDDPGDWRIEEGNSDQDEETSDQPIDDMTDKDQAETNDTLTNVFEQPDIELNGRTYIGSILIPALKIELPVQSQWSYKKLKETPCYYQGSVENGDLVLMAHNYDVHFGLLRFLPKKTEVQFTDIYQRTVNYQLAETVTLDPDYPEKLDEGDWDMTLFTCTDDGLQRVVMRFVRTSA